MDVAPLVELMQQIGIFELRVPPRVSEDQVTLTGRVPPNKDVQYRWISLIRRVIERCRPQEIVDISRAYRVARYMVQTTAGPKPDIKLLWNWRIVATREALPILMDECRSIADALRKKAEMEGAIRQFVTTGEGRMRIPNLQGGEGATIDPLTSGGFRSHGGGHVE